MPTAFLSPAGLRCRGRLSRSDPPTTLTRVRQFEQRIRRAPRDPVNGLLSLGYTWPLTRTKARAETLGSEIYRGGLHEYRAGRSSLGCDRIEPLRVLAVDRWVLAVCNGRQRKPDDFATDENDGVRLRPAIFGDTLQTWETHWVNERLDATLDAWLLRLDQLLRQSTPADPPGDESVDL